MRSCRAGTSFCKPTKGSKNAFLGDPSGGEPEASELARYDLTGDGAVAIVVNKIFGKKLADVK